MNLPDCRPSAAIAWLMLVCLPGASAAQSALPDTSLASMGPSVLGSPEILPGDRIALHVWREPDWSGQFNIDDRGIAVLPRLGPVHVTGLTVGEARVMLTDRFSEYLVTPAVEVTILRRIGVHGEVRNPTLYWLDLTMTVRDAIALAGGLTPAGDPNKIVIRRSPGDVAFDEADTFAAVAAGLQSGDQIVVGRRSWFALNTPFVISTIVSVTSIFVGFLIAK